MMISCTHKMVMYVACWCIGYCSTAVSSAYGDRLTMGMTAVEHCVRRLPDDDLFFAMYGSYQAIDKYNMVIWFYQYERMHSCRRHSVWPLCRLCILVIIIKV